VKRAGARDGSRAGGDRLMRYAADVNALSLLFRRGHSTASVRLSSSCVMRVPKISKRHYPVGRTLSRRIIEGLERLENPKVSASPWWLLVALLSALGAAGTFFVLAGAVLSPMAFDAPNAAAQAWPWVILFSALGLAAICPLALAAGWPSLGGGGS
jgi:hypothetical protein